jgi:acyl-CoA synthetase (NDP forming)
VIPDHERVARLLAGARHRDAGVLLEPEGMAVLEALGIEVPRRLELRSAAEAQRLAAPPFAGERAVVKVVSARILHKTEAGGVAIVPNTVAAIAAAIADMEQRLPADPMGGFTVSEHLPFEPALGHELLVGLRWTADFGPVVTVGAGGVATEVLAGAFGEGGSLAVLSPALADGDRVERALAGVAAVRLVSEPLRGRPARVERARLADVVRRVLGLAERFCPVPLAEFEVNPLVLSNGRLVALDALGTLGPARPAAAAPRPLKKLKALLEPRSVAIVGVSEKSLNPGRVILRNLLRDGFDAGRITVIKPACDAVDGVRCVASIEALPERVDLLVLAISAAQAPDAIAAAADGARAESVILIPGGLEEREGSGPIVARMRDALARSRAAAWRGPVVNGGNCLGIRSVPGRCNTFFIPEYKLPLPRGASDPLALLSGSGAFVVSKASKLGGLNPRYAISVGNQMDLTLADYLEGLAEDPALELFAVYAEGFQPLDGRRLLAATRAITDSGRTVVLYRAGRTRAGAAAAASHTAAIAGDYAVTRALARAAGAVVAETLEDFEDLVALFARLRGRAAAGPRLGALSNAGFECVAIADSLGDLVLADWTPGTRNGLGALLERARLADIVTVRNPIDLTPILGDEAYAEAARLVLEDPQVDVGLVGCVPMTGALDTLARGEGHPDDVDRATSVASRLAKLFHQTSKPWVAVVDAGRLYNRMAQRLEDGGVPTFRTADRALRLLGLWYAARRSADAVRVGTAERPAAARG